MNTTIVRPFIVLVSLWLLTCNLIIGDESLPEEAKATAISDAESIIKASTPHNLTINVKNTHGAKSSLTIEIREGGCDGAMIARFPLRSNDAVTYTCVADYVRIVPDEAANSKYSYEVTFQKSDRKPLTASFDATGKNSLYLIVSNGTPAMAASILVNSATNAGVKNREISIEPKVYANWTEIADLAKVDVGQEANVSFSYSMRFISR